MRQNHKCLCPSPWILVGLHSMKLLFHRTSIVPIAGSFLTIKTKNRFSVKCHHRETQLYFMGKWGNKYTIGLLLMMSWWKTHLVNTSSKRTRSLPKYHALLISQLGFSTRKYMFTRIKYVLPCYYGNTVILENIAILENELTQGCRMNFTFILQL